MAGRFSALRALPMCCAMWLDLVALLVLGVFIGLGAARGALTSILALLTLVVAYALAVLFGSRLGDAAAELTGAPPWLGMPIAGTAGFLVGFLLMAIATAVLRRLEKRGGDRSPRDRALGGFFGGLRGVLVVLLLSYLALWLDALRATGTADTMPSIEGSAAAAVTGGVVEAGVRAAAGDGASGRLMARMASRPAIAFVEIQRVMEHPAVAEVQQDRLFWSYVEHGNPDAALNRASFLRLSYDHDLRRRLGEIGLIEPEAVEDPVQFRASARDVLEEVGPRIRGVRQDPAMQELMNDPQVLARVHSGDHIGLLRDPRFQQVVARALEDGR